MSFFNKNKKKGKEDNTLIKTNLTSTKLEYHPKIILAWAKAIDGNTQLLNYLKDNGFEELAVSVFAIQLDNKSRDWLMQNGYPHLMALINASEGNENAKKWLKINGFTLLYFISEAVDGEQNGAAGFDWLKKNTSPDLYLLAQTIKQVKDKIEERHNDIHSFG
ncbi:MAG: hypothetical protein ACPGU5_05705 [Lishizhenia sp.]